MEVARLVTHHGVTQELCHSRSFSLGVLTPELTQRLEVQKAEVLKRKIVIGLKRTCVSRLSSLRKREGERFEIVEVMKYRSERGPLI
jgi:hypothetical protein